MLVATDTDELDDDALLAELGVAVDASPLTELKHVRSTAEKKAADDVANREKMRRFLKVQAIVRDGPKRNWTPVCAKRALSRWKAEIEKGRFFIVGGQKAYVAEKGETITNEQGRTECTAAGNL